MRTSAAGTAINSCPVLDDSVRDDRGREFGDGTTKMTLAERSHAIETLLCVLIEWTKRSAQAFAFGGVGAARRRPSARAGLSISARDVFSHDDSPELYPLEWRR
jgi:hypothetical protein